MTDAALPARPAPKHFVPRHPAPQTAPLGRLKQLWLLARNPIATWGEIHFRLPIVSGPSLLGRLVVVSDPSAIRRVLVENAANYPKDALQMRVLRAGAREGSGEGLLIAEGEKWKRTRRTLAPLFTPRRVSTFAQAMQDRTEARVARWLKRRPGAILDVGQEMTGLTYDILSATLFSDTLGDDQARAEAEMVRLLDSIGSINPLDVLDAPSWIPRFSHIKARASRTFFEESTARLIAKRRPAIEAGDDGVPDDLLTALIRCADPETGAGLDDAEIAANLFTFIAAGHETTARALGWTLHLLGHATDWRTRCEDEARGASGDPATWLESLPTIRAVFEEAMRLFPPAPVLSRVALAPDRLGEVDVPEGATIMIAPYILHRHKLLWDNPDAFDPARFLPGAREAIDRYAYLPFGAGPRVCIGSVFAMQEAVIVLATILRKVRLERMAGEEPMPVHRITLKPSTKLAMSVRALA